MTKEQYGKINDAIQILCMYCECDKDDICANCQVRILNDDAFIEYFNSIHKKGANAACI